MMFISMVIVSILLGAALFGLISAILAAAFAVLHRKKGRHWMKVAGIVLGIVAALNLLVSGGFFLFIALV